MILVPTLVQAGSDCLKFPVYCDIIKLKPGIDKSFAKSLASSISKYSRIYGIDPRISVAIAMQESSFTNINRHGAVLTKSNQIVRGDTDIGVFQIHIDTIAALKKEGSPINTEWLKRDVDYQALWHARILREKIKTCRVQHERLEIEQGKEWSCYHSFNKKQREVYVNFVDPYLQKLSSFTP